MITVKENNFTHTSGAIDSIGFKVRMTGKSFDLILADIYSDRKAAFIRELGTNAYEAHQEAGIEDTPFEVTLPSKKNPQFSIRDFGNGLSHDDIINIYTVVFESTKTNTNKLGGCFGLGSKSPFAYTNNFAVISINAGKKSTYSVYRDNDGIPKMDLVSTVDSDNISGVEVIVPIKEHDISDIIQKVKSVYRWFDVRPMIVGGQYPTYEKPILSGSNFDIYQDYGSGKLSVKMGNILYDCTESGIKVPHSTHVVIKLPIGSVTPEPGRERLTYTDSTLRLIKDTFEKVKTEVSNIMSNQFSACKDRYSAAELLMKSSDPFLRAFNVPLMYNGKELTARWQVCSLPFRVVRAFTYANIKDKNAEVRAGDISFVYEDTKSCLLIRLNEIKGLKSKIVLVKSEEEMKQAIDIFGIDKSYFIKTSDYQVKTVRAKTTSGVKKITTKLLELVQGAHHTSSRGPLSYWKEAPDNLNIDDGGIYVVYHGGYILHRDKELSPNKLSYLMSYLNDTRMVYGVRKKDAHKLESHSKWIPAIYDIQQSLKQELKTISPTSIYGKCAKIQRDFSYDDKMQNILYLAKHYTGKIPQEFLDIKKIFDDINNVVESKRNYIGEIYYSYYDELPVYSDYEPPTNHLIDTMKENILSSYPLISYLEQLSYRSFHWEDFKPIFGDN